MELPIELGRRISSTNFDVEVAWNSPNYFPHMDRQIYRIRMDLFECRRNFFRLRLNTIQLQQLEALESYQCTNDSSSGSTLLIAKRVIEVRWLRNWLGRCSHYCSSTPANHQSFRHPTIRSPTCKYNKCTSRIQERCQDWQLRFLCRSRRC